MTVPSAASVLKPQPADERQSGLADSPLESTGSVAKRRRRWLSFWRYPAVALAAGFLVLLALASLFAPAIAPYPPDALNPVNRLIAPSPAYPFGTDGLGRDVLSRVIYGGRVSLVVGFASAAVSTLCGVTLGLSAGYFRRLDFVVMRVTDALMAFPGLLLALALMAIQGPLLSSVIIVLGVVGTPSMARLVRSAVLSLREHLYVEAARAVGASDIHILLRHILPNSLAPILVQATFLFASSILAEAALSFLGAGIPTSTPSWGNIMSEGRIRFQAAPWLTIIPGLVISLTVLAISLLGDALGDAVDPTVSANTR